MKKSNINLWIEIPDPTMIQVRGEGPRFIQKRPPTVDKMAVIIDMILIIYMGRPQNAHIKKYLSDLEAQATKEGFRMIRTEDFPARKFNYTFEKII